MCPPLIVCENTFQTTCKRPEQITIHTKLRYSDNFVYYILVSLACTTVQYFEGLSIPYTIQNAVRLRVNIVDVPI